MDCKVTSPMGFWGADAEEVLVHRFPLHKACRDGDPVTLSRLVAEVPHNQLLTEDNFYSWTPIHWAAYFGKNGCLNGLLHCGININLKTSKFQQTPAHIAAFGGHPGTIEMLMKSGADFHAKDYLGEIPLHKAARVGNVKCLEILILSGTQVNMCNNNGLTASQIARNQRFSECLRILEEVNQQQLNSNVLSNGHGIINGSSGARLSNGHTNGMNGSRISGQKRSFDDVSIPNIKKARFSDVRSLDADFLGSSPKFLSNTGRLQALPSREAMISDMDFQSSFSSPAKSSKSPFYVDDVNRAPSPGMDMNWNVRDDPQLWGHLNGYGDTAEDLHDENSVFSQTVDSDSMLCHKLRGVQARGWR